jgi:ketosteroid isomerase-like protein
MRPFLFAAAVGIVVAGSAAVASAQSPTNTPTSRSAATQALIDIETKWSDALVKADTLALDTILADAYVSTDVQGHVSTKAQVIGALKNGDDRFISLKMSDARVRIFGNAAVITALSAVSGTSKGQPFPPRLAVTDTFVRQNGTWRAVATHLSEVQGARAPTERVAATSPRRDIESDKAAIRQFIASAGDVNRRGSAAAWAAEFADGAIYMPANASEVTTAAGLQDVAKRRLAEADTDITISPAEIEIFGEWAYARTAVKGTVRRKNGGAPIPVDGKELAIYRRQPDRSWKLWRLIGNSNRP